MNDDTISRQAAIDAISSMFAPTPTQKDMAEDCLEIIENLPSVERRGRWVRGDEMADYPRVPYKPWETYCSCCGEIMEQSHYNFCGNCGARMDGEEE